MRLVWVVDGSWGCVDREGGERVGGREGIFFFFRLGVAGPDEREYGCPERGERW